MASYQFGLILPASLEYARQILEGASEWAFGHPEVELHLLDETGTPPGPGSLRIQPDGILAFTYTDILSEVRLLSPVIVSCSNRSKPSGADFVITDDVAVGRMGAEHLIRRGYRDLVFAARHGHHYSDERCRGFRERAEEAGLEVGVFETFGQNENQDLSGQLARLPPRAGVFAANDIVARTLMHHTENAIQRIPLHFALLGVDDDPLQRALCPLPLSSIELDGRTVGRLAMERLMRRIQHPEPPHEIIRVPPLHVQTRQSTDLYALDDDLAARVLETMDEFLPKLADVSALVEKLVVPRRTLEHRFRKATGRTLARELATLRIERARDLLRNTEKTVDAVAREIGLPEARMLWLLFKRQTGESPSAYRKRTGIGKA